MELSTKQVWRQEPIYRADIAKLAKALANPASVHSNKNHNGYVCLSGEKASWEMCARVAYNALKGRNHAKATSFVYQLGQEVIEVHGWQDREPPEVIKQKVIELESKGKKKKKIKAVWLDGIDRRPKQLHEQCVGSYCLSIMILLGFCRLEWSNHKDYKCWVVLLPEAHPMLKEPSTYTQFTPFEPWWQQSDEHRHRLVKTDLGTNWKPKGWHFTGQAPSPYEDGVWHPYQEIRQRLERKPYTSIADTKKPIVYRAQVEPPEWVRAVRKHEAVPYRINKRMLDLIQKLDIVDESKPEGVSFIDEAMRLADHEKFYQRMHLDFRGRLYTSRSLINYQGDDKYRCLIEFAEGVELDDIGYNSLCFNAANLWELPDHLLDSYPLGTVDFSEPLPEGPKTTFFLKVLAGRTYREVFFYYADNPLDTYDEWQVNGITGEKLDDPLLFIRACIELRDATTKERMLRRKGFITHLPVEVDQTNSVIQHLALFYGDVELAEMCNLIVESDFYSQIAGSWDLAGLTDVQKRKVVKKIVVPRCYGAGKERIAEEELFNIPFLKDWVPEGESTGKQNPSTQDVIEAASNNYSSRKHAINEVLNVALLEPALKGLKKDAGKDGIKWKDRTDKELENILDQLQEEKNENKKLQKSYADIIRYMQLVGLAEEGIHRVESVVPAIQRYKDELKEVRDLWGYPIDGELAWATMSGFEVHFRPVYTDTMRFRVPRSKEKRADKDRVQLSARHITDRLNETEVKLGLQANFVHSVDATLAHLVVANAEYPVIAVHDAFAAHANNIDELRIDFLLNLIRVHLIGKPLQNFRSDILGEPPPEGLWWDDSSPESLAVLTELRNRMFIGMTG